MCSMPNHQILGPHLNDEGLIIRVFRPDAEQIEAIIGRRRPMSMVRLDAAGLFEVNVPGAKKIPSYKLRIHRDGQINTIRDPYSFPPALGELDLHLFAEGKQEQIYDKLGAHVMKIGGVTGVAFAVWAPQASGVSVVGDFNNWDGRIHQMRMLHGSGVWELFIPGFAAGMLYKFEIHRHGSLSL